MSQLEAGVRNTSEQFIGPVAQLVRTKVDTNLEKNSRREGCCR